MSFKTDICYPQEGYLVCYVNVLHSPTQSPLSTPRGNSCMTSTSSSVATSSASSLQVSPEKNSASLPRSEMPKELLQGEILEKIIKQYGFYNKTDFVAWCQLFQMH